MFRVGVIGATGFIGTPYRQEIREAPDHARLTCLCARRRDLLDAAGAADGVTSLTDDWREVVGHPQVDVVLVATPDALHHEAVMACAAARKHVICEKPIGVNAREAWEIWSAYRDTPAWEFARFLSRAERGTPRPAVDPNGTERAADVEKSLRWIADVLADCG